MSRIVLKSWDSLKYYPKNKPNDFTVKIPNLSSMTHNSKVAIVEIIFPACFHNVRDGHNSIEVMRATNPESPLAYSIKPAAIPQNQFGQTNPESPLADDSIKPVAIPQIQFGQTNPESPWAYSIKPDFYTPTSLIAEITKIIPKEVIEVESEGNNCVITKLKGMAYKLGSDIASILGGFKANEWLLNPDHTHDLMSAYKCMSLLNIYCDIVEESLIGEDHYQLLRIVNWNAAKKNETCPSISYSYPYFIPVKNVNANSINIKITDSLNIPVEFTSDEPVVVILEFRNE